MSPLIWICAFLQRKACALFRVQLLRFFCPTSVPEYLTFLAAILVLFLFRMLIAGTHKYSGRTRSVSCNVGELTCYLLGCFSGFVGRFHM